MNLINSNQKCLLDSLANMLFNKKFEISDLVDINEVVAEAKSQSVISYVYPVIKSHLSNDEKESLKRVNRMLTANNVRVEYEHVELDELMQENKIPYVILKGLVSASYYPHSELRALGDVDFLVAKDDMERAGKVLKSVGFVPTDDDEHECHVAYHRVIAPSIPVSIWEMHWEPNGIPNRKEGDILRGYFSTILKDAQFNGRFYAPSAFHHGLILIIHTATHLINSGVGLRHICDWAAFVSKFSDDEFCKIFEKSLKKVGLWRFAQLLTLLSVEFLGCPEKKWAGTADKDYLELMMADIFKGGNFGYKDEQRINQAKLMTNHDKGSVDDNSLAGQLVSTMNEKARLAMPVTKKVPVLLPLGWAYAGIRHLFRIKSKERPSIDVKEMVKGANERKAIYKEFKLYEKD